MTAIISQDTSVIFGYGSLSSFIILKNSSWPVRAQVFHVLPPFSSLVIAGLLSMVVGICGLLTHKFLRHNSFHHVLKSLYGSATDTRESSTSILVVKFPGH